MFATPAFFRKFSVRRASSTLARSSRVRKIREFAPLPLRGVVRNLSEPGGAPPCRGYNSNEECAGSWPTSRRGQTGPELSNAYLHVPAKPA